MVIIDCYYSDPPFNLPHHFIVYSVSSSMWLSLINCVLCAFHRELTSEEQATYRSCFSIPVESILLLLGSSNEVIVLHYSPIFSVAPPTSVALIFTVAPSSSAPFTNFQCCTNLHCCAFFSVAPFVSYRFVSYDYATLQFYIINHLATDANTPCQLFNCIIEI